MTRPALTVDHLIRQGFRRIGCWELNSSNDLVHSADLPLAPAVYAFAVDDTVQYVGLASKSLKQRFGFYRKPGAHQRTNVRLNETIRDQLHRGTIVQILVAHPPDFRWNDLTVKGVEGLEAGLIADYDLPWNMRGTAPTLGRRETAGGNSTRTGDRILELIECRPGMTELEIAKELFGADAVQQNVNADCRFLLSLGLVERSGEGGRMSPYTYRRANNVPKAVTQMQIRMVRRTEG